jgi:hypothetical protein
MKKKLTKNLTLGFLLIIAVLFIIKVAGPQLLRTYVEIGLGDCNKLPIFCIAPDEEISSSNIDTAYINELIEYELAGLKIKIPKEFALIKEKITKVYYKRKYKRFEGPVIYLLYESPDYFLNLFPQLKKQGISSDYDFLLKTMSAKTKEINNITDAFFAIMKSVFTPDLGDQKNLRMVKFKGIDKKGFIATNIGQGENSFDCNIIDSQNNFFKLYIKDRGALLDLDKVLTIISTVEKIG